MHISFKTLIFIVFFLTMTARLTAQNTDTLLYRSHSVRSFGFGFPEVNNSLLSPLNHSGYSLSFRSTRFREKPEYLSQFHQHFEIGVLHNQANDSYITSLAFAGGFSRHWYASDRTRPLRLLFGVGGDASLGVYLKDDNTNNPVAYFFNLSFTPNAMLKYRFNIQKTKFELSQQIDIPFVSLVSSSDYSASLPSNFVEKDANFFKAMRFVSFNSLKKCVTITTLDITPSPEQRQKWPVFRISYIFSGMNYENGDFTVKSADHVFLFGMIFHLFR